MSLNNNANSDSSLIQKLKWENISFMFFLHIFALHGFYNILFVSNMSTFFWTLFIGLISSQGLTSGAHRLWAHRAYKAKLPLRIFLCFCQTLALQKSIFDWVRDHRVHHKYTDTDADPHNSTRGFFFSHIGWFFVPKHKQVIIKGKKLDMTDLQNDQVVMFQKKYYMLIGPPLGLFLPALIPWYFWQESLYVSWTITCVFRYVLTLHFTWAVNSVAHIWGNKPYDKFIKPTENIYVSIFAFGEGWHNYHHVFPWDYKAAELGNYGTNISTAFIDFMAKIGWAYDLRTVSPEVMKKRKIRTGQ